MRIALRVVMSVMTSGFVACGSPLKREAPRLVRPPAAPTIATPLVPPPATLGNAAAKFAKVDFDGDGLADLAFSAVDKPAEKCRTDAHGKTCWRPQVATRMVIVVYLGRHRGAISQVIELSSGPDELKMGRSHEVGGVGDLDGDGRTELAVQYAEVGNERLLLLRGTPTGLSDPYASIPLPKLDYLHWYGIPPRPAGDVDGDGEPDVVFGPAILRGAGGGRLRDPQIVASPSKTTYPAPFLSPVGDVTGDSVDDLIISQGVTSYGTAKAWLLPSKSGAPVALSVPGFHEAWDLDGDGKSELVGVVPGGGKLAVTTYALSATGARAMASIDVPGDEVHGVAIADTDGSGVRDIAVVTSIGRVDEPCALKCTAPANVHVRLVRGGATLALEAGRPATPSPNAFGFATSERILVRAVGDLDGDGTEELAHVRHGSWRIATRAHGGRSLAIGPTVTVPDREIALLTTYAHFDPGR